MTASEAIAGLALVARLPRFLRRPIRPADAEAIVRRRRRERDVDFLAVVRRAVYGHPGSPYRALLEHAGCEYGDLERLVREEGVEGALRTLLRSGVFLSVGELKGRQPVVRGSLRLDVRPGTLGNPGAAAHLQAGSSGSRGPSVVLGVDLRFLGDVAVDLAVAFAARGASSWELAYWDVPGGVLRPLLVAAKAGNAPRRWFALTDPADREAPSRYRWSARALRWGSWLGGTALPPPEHVPVDAPLPIARWMAGVVRAGRTPVLFTYSSPAVRLCEAARASGLDLGGAALFLYGEPVTRARLAAIRRSGATAGPLYVASETWRLGEGCMLPAAADDVHLLDDLHAVVQPGPEGATVGLPGGTLLVTSLRATAPVILLNASLGDQAVMTARECGCPLERVGWTTHLHTIRSHEKLTAGGMTFLDSDVIRILEETLPARFGGLPTHYQLVEGPADDGHPRVRLLVHPAVGPVEGGAVARAFLDAIADGPGPEAVMARAWREAGLLRVERRPPLATPSGKILHLHLDGRGQSVVPVVHPQLEVAPDQAV